MIQRERERERERDRKENYVMNNKGPSHIFKDHTLFFITVTKTFTIQI